MQNKKYYFLILVFMVLHRPVSAEIFKWTDNDGIVHYSENAPESLSGKASKFDPTSIQLVTVSFAGYKDMLELAQAMESNRLMREKLREQKQQLKKKALSGVIEASDAYRNSNTRYRIYYPADISFKLFYRGLQPSIKRHHHHKQHPLHTIHENKLNHSHSQNTSPAVAAVKK
jgi:hypothetical protein